MGERGWDLGWGLLLDEVEEAVLGSSIHQDVQLFRAGEAGLWGPVIEVAVDMFKVDSDGEAGLNCADGTDEVSVGMGQGHFTPISLSMAHTVDVIAAESYAAMGDIVEGAEGKET
jgi:hypothetical protein